MQYHSFRFGVICEQMQSAEEWITKARRTEADGYSTFLIRDHFIREPFGDQFAPMIAAMAAASATKTLHVGTMVIDNDYRHPVMLAKEVATLDLLSGGRFELGIGSGWLRDEYEHAGLSFDAPGTRVSRLEEALHVLKGLWGAQPFTFSGSHYQITNLDGFPKPQQLPHPPILIGAGSKRMLQIAGREADSIGILPKALPTGTISEEVSERVPSAMHQKIDWIRQAAGERFPNIELSMVIYPHITDQPQKLAEQLIEQRGWNGLSVEAFLEMPSIFVGPLDTIIELMQQRREQYGFSYYIVPDANSEAFAPIVARLTGK